MRNRFTASGNGQILILLLRHSASMEFHCSTNRYRIPPNTRDAQPEAKTGTVSTVLCPMPILEIPIYNYDRNNRTVRISLVQISFCRTVPLFEFFLVILI